MLRVQICQSLAYPLEIETEIERERELPYSRNPERN